MKSADSRGEANWHKAEAKALRAAKKKRKNSENSAGVCQTKKAGSCKATCPESQSQRCYQSSVRLKARARSSTEELTMTLLPDFMVS